MNYNIEITITIMPKKKKKIFPPSARKRRRAATDIQAAFRGWQSRVTPDDIDDEDCECDGDSYYEFGTEMCKKCHYPHSNEYERRGVGACYSGMGRWTSDCVLPEPDICCDLCDYTISQSDLDHGRGRVMVRVGDQLRVCDCCHEEEEDCDDGLERMFCGATRQWLTREEWECECDSEDEDQIDCFHCRIGPHVVNGWN